MKNSIIRPILKGILVPILAISMVLPTSIPTFAATEEKYKPGERESLGLNLDSRKHDDEILVMNSENPGS